MREYLDRLFDKNSVTTLFKKPPLIYLREEISSCYCGEKLNVLKTKRRFVSTLKIGTFQAHETSLICPSCGKIYLHKDLKERIPEGGHFGFDVIEFVGKSMFLLSQNEKEIQLALQKKNIRISIRGVAHLAKKFVVYLGIAHREAYPEIKELLSNHGGYILHLDGTVDRESPCLMSALDGISELVLGNAKLLSENSEEIIDFLEKLKASFGNPVALVHDMGAGILKAVESVFSGVPDFICHFHFLRDLGKDFFYDDHIQIKNILKKFRLKSYFRKSAKTLKRRIDQDDNLSECFENFQKDFSWKPIDRKQDFYVFAYMLTLWIMDFKCELGGYGFPFDRSYLTFYQRVKIAKEKIVELGEDARFHTALFELYRRCDLLLENEKLQTIVCEMEKKVLLFDQLRDAMRIAPKEGKHGLNEDAETKSIKTIRDNVTLFRKSFEIKEKSENDPSYKNVLKQLDKYWDKLFSDPITVQTKEGPLVLYPQRTNNILERFFRNLKKWGRKKGGTNSISRTLKAMITDTPLVKNLENPEYLNLILKGKQTLATRFSEIEIKEVRKQLKEEQKDLEKVPLKMKKFLRMPKFLECLKLELQKRIAA